MRSWGLQGYDRFALAFALFAGLAFSNRSAWGSVAGNPARLAETSHLERFHLDNGLTLVFARSRLAPVAAVQAWVGVGSADEPPRQGGIAHFFEHMLFKGTGRRGVGEIARTVESAGGEINAWTAFDQTVFHITLASRYFETAVDVLADALTRSSFDPTELEREREVILEEIRQGKDDPGRTTAQALFSTAFARHPYRRPVIGEERSVRAIRRDHMIDFFRRFYRAGNLTLVVAGDVDRDRARKVVAERFRDMPAGGAAERPARGREPRQREPRVTVIPRDVREAHLGVGARIPPLRSDDTAALDVAAVALGQGESSRLSRALRWRRELATGVVAYAHSLRESGLFAVTATATPERALPALEAISTELHRLRHEEISADELAKARHAIRADTIYERETAQALARKYGYFETTAGGAEFESEYLDAIEHMSAARVKEAVRRYLSPERAAIAAVVPARERRLSGPSAAHRLVTALGAGATTAAARFAVPAGRGGGADVAREVLPNGVKVVVKRDASVPVVAVRAVWTGGLRLETPANNGITNLIAQSITRGCGDRDAEQIARAVDEMAGSLTGFAGRNTFGIAGEWLADRWEHGFELLSQCILDPRFDEADLARERRRILDDLEAREDNSAFVAFRLFIQTLYRRHPYRLDLLGTPASVDAISRRELVSYYRRNYPVSGMTIAIVGDVDPARALADVRRSFGAVRARKRPKRVIPVENFSGRSARSREVYRFLDREQAHLIIGFPGTTLDDRDRYALDVLTTVLGGQGGRLFVELRDRQALAYRVGAFSVEGIDPGYVAVYLACSPAKLPQAVAGIRREIDRIAQHPITRAELERAKRYLIGTHAISLQRRASQAAAIAFHDAYGLGYDQYKRYPELIDAVTIRDVQRVAAKYLRWDVAVTATVKPVEMSPAAAERARGVRRRRPHHARHGARRRASRQHSRRR